MTKRYDVVGIGNAVVDVIAEADDSFLDLMGIEKGIMQLVERDRGELLYGAMKEPTQAAGGSVANSIAGIGAMGLKTSFLGRVKDDALGRFYAHEMEEAGTAFVNAPVAGGDLPTSRSMIFVSPDGERSMNTYLGISSDVGPEDVPEVVAGEARIIFLEGYLFDKDKGKAAFRRAAELCRKAGGMAGITLSDPFCVDRHRDDFRALVKDLDYVIGNQQEWESLYQTDLSAALEQAATEAEIVVCTRSGHDVVLVRGEEEAIAPVNEVTPVDATGAGDQFAAGFLYGLATGAPLAVAGRMGCIAAAEVIGHIGPRPKANIAALFRKEGLI
ncbi:MAG: adenosine kinase [Pseudomonadota bacterium]